MGVYAVYEVVVVEYCTVDYVPPSVFYPTNISPCRPRARLDYRKLTFKRLGAVSSSISLKIWLKCKILI